jgi:hypothetical protein
MKPSVDPEPGKTLEKHLLELEPSDRPKALQVLARTARETGDLEMERAIRQYREMSRRISPKISPDNR